MFTWLLVLGRLVLLFPNSCSPWVRRTYPTESVSLTPYNILPPNLLTVNRDNVWYGGATL